MKERYIALMEKALSAYTTEHILSCLNKVKEEGLTEHGFPRLTANIGILIAHGRRSELLPLFMEMMEVCCDMFLRPHVKAANEFSVREIVCCINELEDAGIVDPEMITRWKGKISLIVPEACYNVIVGSEDDLITNWAIFGAVSEYARIRFGLGGDLDFVERQLSCQLKWIDENGMYRDNSKEPVHQPIVYDYVSRGLFSMLLFWGYRGQYYEKIDACLKTSGLLTLIMQSPTGEIPFGGRSNQMLFNEGWQAALFEYEAKRYKEEGNTELAGRFKYAAARAWDAIEGWLDKKPISHVKNRFPAETKYGCEYYAYFDKYMITVASFLYTAYLLCDDSIPMAQSLDHSPEAFATTEHFHKVFLKSGGYMAEIDTNAHQLYDANGLGRVHREGAPSAICMTCPCPAQPIYHVDIEPMAFSMCSAVPEKNEWLLGADGDSEYKLTECGKDDSSAFATLLCRFANGRTVKERYAVNENGVEITLEGDGEIGYALPAFCFDGEAVPEIVASEHLLTVSYEGWICRYITNGAVVDLNKTAANRSGYYRAFLAVGQNDLDLKVEISKA